jgi:hypothetical protein
MRRRVKTGAEGCKQPNNQKLYKTSERTEETTCEDDTGEGKEKVSNYIPNGAFFFIKLFVLCLWWRNSA